MKERIGIIILVIVFIFVLFILYQNSLGSINNVIEVFKERFTHSRIKDPIVIWINSTIFIVLSVGILQLILPDRAFGFIQMFRSFITTIALLYTIYIGPIVLLLLLLLFNVSLLHITLIISVMSFIGITFKKGKELYIKMYNKISRH